MRVHETDAMTSFTFSTSALGLSAERLRDCLLGEGSPVSEELRALRAGIGWVDGWGGTVKIGREAGADLALRVDLRTFVERCPA